MGVRPFRLSRRIILIAVAGLGGLVIVIELALSMNGADPQGGTSSSLVTIATIEVPATPMPAGEQLNRANCEEISGTVYLSDMERDWYRESCGATEDVSNSASASAGSSPGSAPAGSTSPAAPIAAPPRAPVSAPAPRGVEVPTGNRLVIPAAGVNAHIYRVTVPSSGAMPDPVGYFHTVSYDFRAFPGAGGDVNSGNLILSGHVDCARCYSGGSGTAVFWSIRSLNIGATAQVYEDNGRVTNYVVVSSTAYSPYANWAAIVAAGAADMTLITCTGTFSGGHYDTRHVVALRKS